MNFFEHLRTFQVRILWQGHSRSTDGKHFLIRPILTLSDPSNRWRTFGIGGGDLTRPQTNYYERSTSYAEGHTTGPAE